MIHAASTKRALQKKKLTNPPTSLKNERGSYHIINSYLSDGHFKSNIFRFYDLTILIFIHFLNLNRK